MFVVLLAAVVGHLWLLWTVLTMVMIHAGRPVVRDPAVVANLLGATAARLMALGATPAGLGRVDASPPPPLPHRPGVARHHPAVAAAGHRAARDRLASDRHGGPGLLLYRRGHRDPRTRSAGCSATFPHGLQTQVLLASAQHRRLDTIALRTEAAALVAAIDATRTAPAAAHPRNARGSGTPTPPSRPAWSRPGG
jgi:hypothetical protein